MNIPQTGRQPITMSDDEIRKTLRKRHSDDQRDYFAIDPNPDIRQLGRLALRRDNINDLFALGDLCAKRAITEEGRLLIFYVDKTLIAYQQALETAKEASDREVAQQAILDFTDWTVASARMYPSRRNLAVALWAVADDETDHKDIEHEQMIATLLNLYQQQSLISNSFSQTDDLTNSMYNSDEDHTVIAPMESDYDMSDLDETVADMGFSDTFLAPDSHYSVPSETVAEFSAQQSLTSVEREFE